MMSLTQGLGDPGFRGKNKRFVDDILDRSWRYWGRNLWHRLAFWWITKWPWYLKLRWRWSFWSSEWNRKILAKKANCSKILYEFRFKTALKAFFENKVQTQKGPSRSSWPLFLRTGRQGRGFWPWLFRRAKKQYKNSRITHPLAKINGKTMGRAKGVLIMNYLKL